MKNIIITGSSNGFGFQAAKDFADQGNHVFATMRQPDGKNAEKKAELEAHSDHIKVVDAYLKLAEMPFGKRPTRTVVGITWGVDKINDLTQPIQDSVLKEMQLDAILGGASA